MRSSAKSIGLIIGIMLVAIAGGLLRLLLDRSEPLPIDAKIAAALATCLPTYEVSANSPISLASAHHAGSHISPPAANELVFEAMEPIPAEPVDAQVRARFGQGEAVTLEAGSSVRVSKGGEFVLKDGSIEVHRPGARAFLLRAGEGVRFKPSGTTSYIVQLTNSVEVPNASRMLPIHTRGILQIPSGRLPHATQAVDRQPLSLVPVQPITVRPWLVDTTPTLFPLRAMGSKGLGDLSVEVRQPGFNFGTAGLVLNACAWKQDGEALSAYPVGVAEAKPGQVGAATVAVTMNSNVLPAFGDIREWWKPVHIAIVSSNGEYAGYGNFSAIDRGWAGLIATLTVLGLFWGVANLRHGQLGGRKEEWGRWIAGLFIGPDRDPSLSLFQILFWTMITVWGLAYVYVVTGSLLSMTASMMALLGIAGTGSVLARWIGVGTSQGSEAKAAPNGRPEQPFEFGQMLSTNGHFDLLKLQLFVFTLMIGVYVVWRITETAAFPELDANTLLLLGVSQGVYIGGKLTGTTALSRAQTLKLHLDLKREEEVRVEAELEALKGRENDLNSKKSSGQQLMQMEEEDLRKIPGEVGVREKKLKEIGDKIGAISSELNRALKDLGLTAT